MYLRKNFFDYYFRFCCFNVIRLPTDLPAVEYLLGTSLPAGAPVALVLPLQPLAGRGGAGALQELLLDGRHCRLYH